MVHLGVLWRKEKTTITLVVKEVSFVSYHSVVRNEVTVIYSRTETVLKRVKQKVKKKIRKMTPRYLSK